MKTTLLALVLLGGCSFGSKGPDCDALAKELKARDPVAVLKAELTESAREIAAGKNDGMNATGEALFKLLQVDSTSDAVEAIARRESARRMYDAFCR